jgi:hypothetical protein
MNMHITITAVALCAWAATAAPAAGMRCVHKGVAGNHYKQCGRFELRMRMLGTEGCVNCLILVNDQSGSPESGSWQECDFEIVGGRPTSIETVAHVFRHSNMYPGRHIIVPFHESVGENFHTWAFEWTPDHFAWEVDGRPLRRAELTAGGVIHDVAYSSVPPYEPVQEITQSDLDWITVWSNDNMRCAFDVWQCDNPDWCGSWDPSNNGSAVFYSFYKYYAYTPGAGPNGSDFTLDFFDDFDGTSFDETAWEPYGCVLRDGFSIAVLNGSDYTGEIPHDPGEVTSAHSAGALSPDGGAWMEYRSGAVHFGAGIPGRINLSIYDVRGRFIRTLIDTYSEAGSRTVSLKDFPISAGTYVVRMQAPDALTIQRAIILPL